MLQYRFRLISELYVIIASQVWDYETGACVQTLEGHTHNVTAVCVHPEAPIVVTGSEDKTLRVWNATNFRYIYLSPTASVKFRTV